MRLTAIVPVLWLGGALGLVATAGFTRDTGEPVGAASKPSSVSVSDGRAAASSDEPAPRRTWKGKKGVRYERSYRICSVFTVKEVARELGVPAQRKAAARAHASAFYEAQFWRAAYRGCLDAFRGRPPALG